MATQRAWPEQSDFLKAFGQPERITPCTCERSGEPTLEQSLQLLNGPFVDDQIRGSAEQLQGLDDEHHIQELYWTAFSRPPTREENHTAKAYLKHQDDRHRAIQDLVWVMVNCQEFMFQH